MLDKMLEAGAGFDWITPFAAMIQDVANGPSHTFLIPYESCPISGREIELLLKRRGVKTWGTMIVSGTLMVSVKLHTAQFAQYLLEQAGVPIENPMPGGQQRAPAPRASSRRRRGSRAQDMASRSRLLRRLTARR